MKENSINLMKLLNGERVEQPPFWEVWFCMYNFCLRRYGDYFQIKNRIQMAEDLNMAAVFLGGINTEVSFIKHERASDGRDHYSGGQLIKREQLKDKKMPDWDNILEKMRIDREIVKKSGHACWVTLPWCFHSIATSMGLENFALTLHDDFDFIDEAFEWVEQRNRDAIENIITKIQPDFVLFDGDCAYKTGLMVQPEIFKKLVFNKTYETVKLLRQNGIPYTFHSDGNLYHLIPLLIDLGFCAVHGCEKTANDLDYLVDNFGDDIVLVGNMDVVFLANSTAEEVREETHIMLKTGSRKRKFIAACNTSPQDYIPDDNYIKMTQEIELYKKHTCPR